MFFELLRLPATIHALIAGALVAIVSGAVGPFVVTRNSAFAVHGISELAFTGAAAGLLLGIDPVLGALVGSLVVALIIGLLAVKERERDSAISTILAFGLGLGVLFLHYYRGYATASYNLLFGQVTSVTNQQLFVLAVCSIIVITSIVFIYRPLLFSSVDPEVAESRGVPVRALSIVFILILGFTVAEAVQVVGVLLILALLITPAAAAQRITARPVLSIFLAMLFAFVASDGGIAAALKPGIPPSVFVTSISFAIYIVARFAGPALRGRRRSTKVSSLQSR